MPLTTMGQDTKVSRDCPGERTCSEHPCPRRMEVCGAVAVCVTLCLLSLGVCVLVYVRTSELQARVTSLERQREPQHSAWMFVEQVEPVLLNRLDQMLEEVSAFLRCSDQDQGHPRLMQEEQSGCCRYAVKVCCICDASLVSCSGFNLIMWIM